MARLDPRHSALGQRQRIAAQRRAGLLCGVFVALTWQVGQHVLTSFVISDRYSVYGVVGSFIAVMVWFYYASAVLFLGAEIVHALSSADDQGGSGPANKSP